MIRVERPRAIIDRKRVVTALADIVDWSGYSTRTHGQLLDIIATALDEGRAEIRRRFEEEAWPGEQVVRAHAFLMDQVIRILHDLTLRSVYPLANPTTGERIAVVATGGYGRGELAPHSDIDLMFLVPYKLTAHTEQVVEFILYALWDTGLTVGQSTRSVDDAIRLSRDDLTIRTNLLESRLICGSRGPYNAFRKRYVDEVMGNNALAFVEEKLAERDARHDRMGDTRYVLEPNVKEGKGGLRDLQTLFWIAKYLYQVSDVSELIERGVFTRADARLFAKASNFLWTVRCHLHYLAGRAEDRLTFDVQEEIGRRMGYTDHAGTRGVERFMKHYFLIAKDVGDLTRVLCAVLEEQHKKRQRRFRFPSLPFGKREIDGFELEGGRLTVRDDKAFRDDPVKLIRLFREALDHDADIHPRALRLAKQSLGALTREKRRDPEANACFLDILTHRRNPEKILMTMNETGVFGRFVPDFGRVVAQMQYDMYHVYTVDEHTIRAIGILHRIEAGELAEDHPVSTRVVREVQSRRVLYLAVLLHDIAKGRGGDHSEIGADIALELCPRLGLSAWETETVSWLVRHHLLMSRTAFKRDLDDPRTVSDFVQVVQSPERLRLLLVLTVADIRAVGPNVWNAWKAELLRELYYRAQEALSGAYPAERRQARADAAKAAVRERLADWDEAEVERFLGRDREGYWLAFDTDTLVRHAELIRRYEAEESLLYVEATSEAARDVTEIIVFTPDHPGLFAAITGAIALSGASVVDAKILTLSDGMALDTFWIQDDRGGAYADPRRVDRLKSRIAAAIHGELRPGREIAAARARALPSRTRVFTVPPRVLVDNTVSAEATVIEVNGRDRMGLLYEVAAALTDLGLQISSAHVSTYGERVVDVFYVRDAFGLKVESEAKIEALRQRLLDVLAPPDSETAQPPRSAATADADPGTARGARAAAEAGARR